MDSVAKSKGVAAAQARKKLKQAKEVCSSELYTLIARILLRLYFFLFLAPLPTPSPFYCLFPSHLPLPAPSPPRSLPPLLSSLPTVYNIINDVMAFDQ